MKKILYSFLILSSAALSAQKNPSVKFAVANDIVGTVGMFTAKKAIVQSSNVYKSPAGLPQDLKKYSFIAEKGLTEFKIKNGYEGLDRISLAQLNSQYGVPENTPVFIEGYEFSDSNTKIYGDIMGNVEVRDHNGRKTVFLSTSALK
ncbi:hypothetical protein [Chryseobacterium lathyri]|uniref:Uncharacterized protein n=1 Tax=Chryseobacterium lathyri TaxID=395933 RepID=A0ABT9SQ10_9FLAO|nr:hypothetical protein [Chryseobacterium lathyri]MDP9961516.1 hypothetical protein [Chryseobacterium lathyri]MDQ0065393.1 hypothetical protein [Chryseobacterium lathyri]